MKTEGPRFKDGFIHDDDCGRINGDGPCCCSVLVTKHINNIDTLLDVEKAKVKSYMCSYCRTHHEGDCSWKRER